MGNLTITEVRARLVLARPYFGVAAMNLKPIETKGIGTLGVDKHWRLYYDPAALAKWSNSECAAVLEHELMHLLRDHAGRQQGRDHHAWNASGDLEINDDLSGLPVSSLHPDKFGLPCGQTAEQYFDALPEQEQGGQGDGEGDGDNPSQGNQSGNQPNPSGNPDCGSGCGGPKRPWEKDGADGGVSPVEGEAIRKQTAEAVKNAGNAPAGLKRWAEEILTPPRIPWSRILPAACRTALSQGTPQRYRYPSRRDHGDLILPRLISCRPSAALVIDSSGSMTDKDLALAIAITRSALRACDLSIFACDTEAKRVERLAPGSIVGGGGTDMMNGIKVALENKPRPHAVIIITDCYSPWDSEAPPVPVVILTANPDQAPKWAKVIEVEA